MAFTACELLSPQEDSGSGGSGGQTQVQPPSAPRGVAATLISSDTINVTWNSVSGATSYSVYFENSYNTERLIAATNVTSTLFNYSNPYGLSPGATYRFYVKARNSGGESDFSTASSSVTIPYSGI